MTDFVLAPNFLTTVGLVVLAIYLSYIRLKRKTIKNMWQSGTRAHNLYAKFYSPQFLVISIVNASLSVLSLAYGIYELKVGPPVSFVVALHTIVQIVTPVVLLYLAYLLFIKKDATGANPR